MKYNIEPIINKYFSCHQALLATYASYQKRDYDMIFSESWGFGYQKDDYPFGISLNPNCQNRRSILLEKFHGIKIENVKYSGTENLLKNIQSILPYSPILLHCDGFDCPWNMAYKRIHMNHNVLITGLDYNTKRLIILDPYCTKDENIIDVENIAPYSGEISSFITKPLHSLKKEDYHFEITSSYNHIRNSGSLQNLESFRNDFQIRFEEIMCFEYTDEKTIHLILNLSRIANQRYCYCIFLNKMIDRALIDSSILRIMESNAEKYGLLGILLIKQIMKKKNSSKCTDILSEIINNEYEAYEKMRSFI